MKSSSIVVSGQSKTLYESDKAENLILEFRDDFLSSPGRTRKIKGRGENNNQLSSFLFEYLESYHVGTHFIKRIDARRMLIRRMEMIPVRILIRNIATGLFCKKYNFEEGTTLDYPVLEHYLKTGEQEESFVNEFHIYALHFSNPKEMKTIERMASKVNALLKSFFGRRSLQLVDFILEFGRCKGKIFVSDEITAETCTIWDLASNERYNHDFLEKDSRVAEKMYKTLLSRIIR